MTTEVTKAMTVDPGLHRFSVHDYRRMSEAGILDPDSRDELLEGVIYDMPAIREPHAETVDLLSITFVRPLDPSFRVRVQGPIRLGERSEPQPDITIALTRPGGFARAHPGPAEIVLVIEVSDPTYRKDVSVKLPAYAAAGLLEFWIVNLAQRRIEVYQSPRGDAYLTVRHYQDGDSVAPQAFPDLFIQVSAVLPERI